MNDLQVGQPVPSNTFLHDLQFQPDQALMRFVVEKLSRDMEQMERALRKLMALR